MLYNGPEKPLQRPTREAQTLNVVVFIECHMVSESLSPQPLSSPVTVAVGFPFNTQLEKTVNYMTSVPVCVFRRFSSEESEIALKLERYDGIEKHPNPYI